MPPWSSLVKRESTLVAFLRGTLTRRGNPAAPPPIIIAERARIEATTVRLLPPSSAPGPRRAGVDDLTRPCLTRRLSKVRSSVVDLCTRWFHRSSFQQQPRANAVGGGDMVTEQSRPSDLKVRRRRLPGSPDEDRFGARVKPPAPPGASAFSRRIRESPVRSEVPLTSSVAALPSIDPLRFDLAR